MHFIPEDTMQQGTCVMYECQVIDEQTLKVKLPKEV